MEIKAEHSVLPYAEQAMKVCRSVLLGLSTGDLERRTPCAELTVHGVGDHLQRSMLLLSAIAGSELTVDPDQPLAESITALAEGTVLAWRQRGIDGDVAVGRTITPARLAAEIVTLELVCTRGTSPVRSEAILPQVRRCASTFSPRHGN